MPQVISERSTTPMSKREKHHCTTRIVIWSIMILLSASIFGFKNSDHLVNRLEISRWTVGCLRPD
jgi:hypothetical protein